MRSRTGLFAVFVGLLAASLAASAATRYVSDELSINLRRGPGVSYRISQLLDAGQKLESLSEDSGWTRVRTPGGSTGYVLTRFLSDQPAARKRIAAMQQQTRQLQSENDKLEKQLAETRDGSQQLENTRSKLNAENKSLKSQLQKIRETSSDAIRIGNENEKFREQLISMRSENERLRHQNQALKSRREGMKIGALILVGGIVVGLVLPLFRRRRKGSWESL